MSAVANSPARELEELEYQLDGALARLATIETANEEFVPAKVVDRLHHGDPPLRVWREYREQTVESLSAVSGVDADVIESIEADVAEPVLSVAARLARALDVRTSLLVPWRQD